ncbi:MAG TPA: Rieske 2Fe-2S domain-containing protein [Dehalococcoidia bacterium]|nr:Rieske 2Fe-2S domain-containing protein [Dehalococcoidia bacterium]
MATQTDLNLDDLVQETPTHFRVNRRIYADPAIFQLEMERIYHRGWVYVSHETEIPDGGDYKLTYIGKHPVIVARSSDDGLVRVFFNRCRHRGATVCQLEYGNSNYFRCAYHGWVYNNTGGLVGVPFEEGYGEGFDKDKLGLVQVPRVDSYKGFVFASLSADGISLDQHLGNAKRGIDFIVGDGNIWVSKGNNKFGFDGNWKLQYENTVDAYHFPFVHETQVAIRIKHMPPGTKLDATALNNQGSRTRDLGNGHNTLVEDPYDLDYEVPAAGMNFNIGVFPNLDVLALEQVQPTHIRHIRPIAHNRTEVTIHPLIRGKDSPEVTFKRLRQHEEFYGPAGFGAPDDWAMFDRVQRGMAAEDVEWILFSRGLQAEEVDEARGIRTNRGNWGEASQRALYRQWKRVMAE